MTAPDRLDPDPLDAVAAVADAVLFEGYLLYPYRASAQKNALRWQFGVLVPPAAADRLAEPTRSRTELLLEPRAGATLRLRVRFLQVQQRTLVGPEGAPLDELTVDGTPHFAWDEALPRQVDAAVPVDDLRERTTSVPVALPASETREPITDPTGTVHGAYVRTTRALAGHLLVSAVPVPGPYGALRLRLDVVNDASAGADEPREEVLRSSLISAHTVLGLDAGAFLSSADPPEWARPAVAECVNAHSWPVLAGPRGQRPAGPGVADHPRRPPPARPGEPHGPLRRHGERRDPQPAHARPHRRREARGARHRPARGRHPRRARRDGPGDVRAAPRHGAPRGARTGGRRTTGSPPSSRRARRGGTRPPTRRSTPTPTAPWSTAGRCRGAAR